MRAFKYAECASDRPCFAAANVLTCTTINLIATRLPSSSPMIVEAIGRFGFFLVPLQGSHSSGQFLKGLLFSFPTPLLTHVLAHPLSKLRQGCLSLVRYEISLPYFSPLHSDILRLTSSTVPLLPEDSRLYLSEQKYVAFTTNTYRWYLTETAESIPGNQISIRA